MNKVVKDYTSFQKIIYLITNFEYIGTLLCITAVYFLTTGIQFWITDYWMAVLGKDKATSSTSFAICAITGPVAGVVLGGFAFTKLGGFENHRAFPLAVSIMTFGSLVASPLPFAGSLWVSFSLLWI